MKTLRSLPSNNLMKCSFYNIFWQAQLRADSFQASLALRGGELALEGRLGVAMGSAEKPTLRSIKEEMRLAIACEWLRPGTIFTADEGCAEGDVGVLEESVGTEISSTVTMHSMVFYKIRDAIEEKYKKYGYGDIAANARKQVSRSYVSNLLKKYDISLEEMRPQILSEYQPYTTAMRERDEYAAQKRRVENIIAYSASAVVIALALLMFGGSAGWFGESDNRTDAEKRLDEICAAQGYSGCSSTAREIKRISEQND